MKAGETTFVRAGTYSPWLVMLKSGTASKPITVRAYGSEKPVITGRFKIAANYLRVSGFVPGRNVGEQVELVIYVAGGDNVEIVGNEITKAR